MKVPISEIVIKNRIRKEIGDLSRLKESILKYGLINPITVSDKKILLAGYRRLQAAKSLGWKEIDCHIMSVKTKLAKLQIEAEENLFRKDFTPLELKIYEEEKEYALARGLRKIILWIQRLFRKFREIFARFLRK